MRPNIVRAFAVIVATLSLTCVAAMGFEPMTATIRVSSGALYDYVVIGEHPKANNGFDNAYDTIYPGNLNADMGEPYISIVIPQPEWNPALRELKGDVRSPAKGQKWQLVISSSLAKGTPLKLELQAEGTSLPPALKLMLIEGEGRKKTDLRLGEYIFPAPGAGKTTTLFITAEQP
ncbi:hypothetical protein [Geomonas azotofigens]|uniref:hypothetical protein n=1 Tax=Geomonas azotofigens TaxID=2843196 RepID=UPI001C1028C3|nr:hypothetical protein [Geomonas azotofigens]MBU5614087.1 hypothetical protein [Geomonas azotofigens]